MINQMMNVLNHIFLFIRSCKNMKDYGASLSWPEPPRALRETASKFESMFRRWRGYMVIRRVAPEDRDMLKRKLLAWELVGAGSGKDHSIRLSNWKDALAGWICQ